MRLFLWALAAIITLGPPALAQTYPDRPVKIIVDSGAGSATDITVRLMANRLSQIWKQQAVVENRPGAGGSIAVRAASLAEPDGYTLFVGAASVFTAIKGAPGVAPNLPVELTRDFAPIGFMTLQPVFIAVAPSLGIDSLPGLITLAKQKPGELSYATTGPGRFTHLTMELLQSRAGIFMQMIPYAGGPHAAMADLATGRVAAIAEGYSGLAEGLTGGLIRAIAVASDKRLPDFTNLATVAETLPGFLAGGWNVLLAPAGTPEAVTNKVSADLRKALDDAEVKRKLAAMGAYLHPMTAAEVTAFTQEQQRTWQPVAARISKQAGAGR